MEPITTALVAALGKLAEPAVRDAYEGLKALIVKKLGAKHAVVNAVENLEKKPESSGRRETLGEELAESAAAADAGIVAAARALLENVQKHGGGQAGVKQTVTGDRNIFSGTGDINIGGRPP
ncbi:MAG: hypothetical protein ACREH8_00880 [Opitutaceae bacterium]